VWSLKIPENSSFTIKGLAVTLRNPVFLKEDVNVVPSSISDKPALLSLQCDGTDSAEAQLQSEAQKTQSASFSLPITIFLRQHYNKIFAELKNAEGSFELIGDAKAINSAFPHSVRALGIDGGSMTGTVNAFMRPPLISQPDMTTVKSYASRTPSRKCEY
jgi:hypothetical protein